MEEKIIVEIHRLKGELEGYSAREALDYIESYINILASQPSLPSNLDEAAWKYGLDNQNGFCSQSVKVDCFKAGAEWMAGQGVEAHCVESANPVSESPNTRLQLITLLYEENEHTPYVCGGDDIGIIIRKK